MTTEQRIQRLERTNRRYRWGIAIVIFAAMIVGAAGAGDDVSDVIRARKCEVMNEEGTPVALTRSWEPGGGVNVTGNKGTPTCIISHTDDGDGMVTTPSARGTPLVELTATFVVSIHNRRRKDHTLHQSNVVPPRHIRRRWVAAMHNAMPRERPVPLRRVRRWVSASLPESSNSSCARPRRLESRCSRRWRGRWLRLRRGCDALLRH